MNVLLLMQLLNASFLLSMLLLLLLLLHLTLGGCTSHGELRQGCWVGGQDIRLDGLLRVAERPVVDAVRKLVCVSSKGGDKACDGACRRVLHAKGLRVSSLRVEERGNVLCRNGCGKVLHNNNDVWMDAAGGKAAHAHVCA